MKIIYALLVIGVILAALWGTVRHARWKRARKAYARRQSTHVYHMENHDWQDDYVEPEVDVSPRLHAAVHYHPPIVEHRDERADVVAQTPQGIVRQVIELEDDELLVEVAPEPPKQPTRLERLSKAVAKSIEKNHEKPTMLGFTLIPKKEGDTFSGAVLQPLLEESGFRYGTTGLYVRVRNKDPKNVVCQVLSLVEPGYFVEEDMPHSSFAGIAFVFDPSVTPREYDDIIVAAQRMALVLPGQLADLMRRMASREMLKLQGVRWFSAAAQSQGVE